MFWQFLIWLVLAASVLEFLYLLHVAWASARVPRLILGDVVHFLHPVDPSLLASLLDPAADFELRWNLGPRAFREEQHRRLRIYRELLLRMARNSAVLAEFDNAVRNNNNDDLTAGPGSKLQEAAIKVRLYCLIARAKLGLWLWLPNTFAALTPVTLAHLRKAASLDGPRAYEDLKAAAAEAFAQLQPAELEALTHNL
jgi:hypothetical protein